MIPTPEDISIMTGQLCGYCGSLPELISSKLIYGKDYGMVWRCPKCSAYVGAHSNSDKPLGRLANASLRKWKKRAHMYFDPLWELKTMVGVPKQEARKNTYEWLSRKLDIPFEYTHIGMFNSEQCRAAIKVCESKREQINETIRTQFRWGT